MKILVVNLSDHAIPPPPNAIRADTYISVPLAEELKKREHNVFFLCPQGSKVKVKKIFTSTGPFASQIPTEELNKIGDMGVRTELLWAFHCDLYLKLLEAEKKYRFDILHIHTNIPIIDLVFTNRLKTPCLFTLHWIPRFPDSENKVLRLFQQKKNRYFVSLSDFQRKAFPSLPFIKTVHNAIFPAQFPFNPKGGNHLVFAGRFKRSKGLLEAAKTAVQTQKQLKFTGTISMSYSDQEYFKKEVLPLAKKHPNLLFHLPFIERNKIPSFYGKGKATLFPIQWEEPFGLAMIESMATGTPVVAFARGSVPEVIKDGETGFIVNPSSEEKRGKWIIKKTGIAGLCEAVKKIYSMPEKEYQSMRKACRKYIKNNFSFPRLVNEYEEVYKKIIKREK